MSDLDCPVCWNRLLGEIVITTVSSGEDNGLCNHSMCAKCFHKLREEAAGQPRCPLCRRIILSVTKNQLAMNIMTLLAKEKGYQHATQSSKTSCDRRTNSDTTTNTPTTTAAQTIKVFPEPKQSSRPKRDIFRRTHSYSGRSEVFFDDAYNVHYDLRENLQDLGYPGKEPAKTKISRFTYKALGFIGLAGLTLSIIAFMKLSYFFCFGICAIFCLWRYF